MRMSHSFFIATALCLSMTTYAAAQTNESGSQNPPSAVQSETPAPTGPASQPMRQDSAESSESAEADPADPADTGDERPAAAASTSAPDSSANTESAEAEGDEAGDDRPAAGASMSTQDSSASTESAEAEAEETEADQATTGSASMQQSQQGDVQARFENCKQGYSQLNARYETSFRQHEEKAREVRVLAANEPLMLQMRDGSVVYVGEEGKMPKPAESWFTEEEHLAKRRKALDEINSLADAGKEQECMEQLARLADSEQMQSSMQEGGEQQNR